jgi:electron transfer flavoprotein alpha subunit
MARELLSFAASTGEPAAIALLGPGAGDQDCFAYGAQVAYTCADPALAEAADETIAMALGQVVERSGCDIVLIGSTLSGRAVAAHLAQRLGAGCITDANGLRCERDAQPGTSGPAGSASADHGGRLRLIATRYALGGNTLATECILPPHRQVIAVMPQTFEARPRAGQAGGTFEALSLAWPAARARTVERQPKQQAGADVESADVVVCVGRGLGAAADLQMAGALAEALGGVLACTRPVSHDRHWLPEKQMVGISGKIISPRLYVGIALSGQIQHTVGITGARVTVAINSDKGAPIFKMADYGIVGDAYEVVPRLVEKLGRR